MERDLTEPLTNFERLEAERLAPMIEDISGFQSASDIDPICVCIPDDSKT